MHSKIQLIVQPTGAWPGEPGELDSILVRAAALPADSTGLFWRSDLLQIPGIKWRSNTSLMLIRAAEPLAADQWRLVVGEVSAEEIDQAFTDAYVSLHPPGRSPIFGLMMRRASIMVFYSDQALLYFADSASGHSRIEEMEQLRLDHPHLFAP